MKNQVFRITDETEQIEFSIIETNDIEPYRPTLTMEVISFREDGTEYCYILEPTEIKSLIDYLERCHNFIEDFNKKSKP